DIYMEKIAIGRNLPSDVIDLNNSVKKNISNLAKAKKCLISDLIICILARNRHIETIKKIREAGAKVKLIEDGDISAVISTSIGDVDMYIGIGGAPEGVLAAAALKTLGGQITARLIFDNESDIKRAKSMGINDLNYHYRLDDLVRDDVIFAATGVTDGELLKGVKKSNGFTTNTILLDSKTKSSRIITNQII
ncbi:MAG: fructose-bisphosphatase class II, partial [Rickettsiales bacterium]